MQVLTIHDLMRMTKIELTVLEAKIIRKLPEIPEASPERSIALTNLRNIRRVLVNRARFSFGP